MKTILFILLSVLVLTSCNKKECETANQRVQNELYNLNNASYTYLIDPTEQNHNRLMEAKQQYQAIESMRDNVCN
jgi:outer membrane lipoprotein-sorting protein